jgi:transcriptional regulator with XRE-family HTH domain
MADTQNVELKDRLAEALRKRNMRAVDLVEAAGIPKSAISFYLSGKSKPKADRLYKIAKTLDINEAWLLGYDVQMDRSAESKKMDKLARLVLKMKNDVDFFDTVSALAELDEKQYRGVKDLVAALKK